MFELIEKLRRKTDKQKKIIAFLASFFICSIIFIFWVLSIMPNFRLQQEAEKRAENLAKRPSSELGGLMMDNFNQIKKQISELVGISKFFTSSLENYNATSTTETATTTMVFSTTTEEDI